MTNADQGRDAGPQDPPATTGESRRVALPIQDWRSSTGPTERSEQRKVIWRNPAGEATPPPRGRSTPSPGTPGEPSGQSRPAASALDSDSETEEIPAISLAAFAEAAAIASGDPAPTPDATSDSTEDDESTPAAPSRGTHGRVRYRNTRRVLIVGLAVVLAALGGLAARLTFPPESSSAAGSGETVVLPSPTPTVQPVQREDGTAFFASLPSTVNDFALSGYTTVDTSLDPDLGSPLEAYTLTYTNGSDLILLYAAQWETEAEQSDATPTLLRQLSDTSDLELMPTWIRDFATAKTAKSEVWGNETAAFSATGPEADVRRFKQAFPM